jgi:hypothetical protein
MKSGAMSWRMAHALGGTPQDGLLGEINASAPNRNRASDGGIGDARHSAQSSDHNPCACCGIVCARDFTHDPHGGLNGHQLAAWLEDRARAGDTRIKYVIWNKRIMSGPGQTHPCGVWRTYRGKNPHTKHVHLSVTHDQCDDTAPWGWPPQEET